MVNRTQIRSKAYLIQKSIISTKDFTLKPFAKYIESFQLALSTNQNCTDTDECSEPSTRTRKSRTRAIAQRMNPTYPAIPCPLFSIFL